MKLEQAARQALESLVVAEEFVDRHSEDWYISGQQDLKQIRESITALREALANPEERGTSRYEGWVEVAKQEPVAYLCPSFVDNYATGRYETCEQKDYGAFPVYAAPVKQAEQEPVAWLAQDDTFWLEKGSDTDVPLYAAPFDCKGKCCE